MKNMSNERMQEVFTLVKDINDFKYEDFELVDYQCHGKLEGKVAV